MIRLPFASEKKPLDILGSSHAYGWDDVPEVAP